MTREQAILWLQVLKHSKINWLGEKAEEEDIIARCEEAEQEALDMAIEALSEPSIVRCGECKHRPHLNNADGAEYGFNVVNDNGDSDGVCPCLCEDGWYSWMPKDNFFCGYGERREP